ncbi:MAG: 2-octaprenyl-6-methoxyphenyl hydroxylase [Proteobacteria bacterium]|nr:2-octaprenyl-6-methoxyphenyl hydroxylase [Pseudomonadota bacterium]MDA0992499.1 2-octaprenyl-6-methoxyphenyl hydroxylase [Pseudomonadota bacterium]
MSENKKQPDYDIVIAGGGMIGTSLGLALAPLNLKIAVVEAVARSSEEQPSFDDRSTALSRSSQRMFEAMGLWPDIVTASTPIKSIHVSDKGHFGFAHIDAAEQKVEALGYVVINRVLGKVLQDSLAALDNVQMICPGKIVAVTPGDDFAEVTVEKASGPRNLTCRLLVAADGANSAVRDMVGIGAKQVSYDQWAVIGNLLTEKAMAYRAFERFTEAGPVALLPVADGRAAFVWIQPPDAARAALSLDDDEFVKQIQDAFGFRLGRFSRVGKRAAYPLSLSKANSLISRRSVIVGNAAHGLHPVAAQGFNLGMRDVAALCDCIADARAESGAALDCGDATILENYAEWRAPDHRKLVRFTDGIVRLFGDSRAPVRILRNLGMLGFDLVPGVRKTFARHTMGLAGRLPRLARGVPLE